MLSPVRLSVCHTSGSVKTVEVQRGLDVCQYILNKITLSSIFILYLCYKIIFKLIVHCGRQCISFADVVPCLACMLLIFAPRLGVYYFLSLTLSVCLSVCPSVCLSWTNFKLILLFCFSMESNHFWPSVLHDTLYKTLFFDFWCRPPNAQNLMHKICTCTKSPISGLVWQIDRRCLVLLGGFRDGRFNGTMQNVVGPTLVAMATKFWANLAYICTKSPISRLVWLTDRTCLGLPGGPTLVAMATTFGLGAEIYSPTGLLLLLLNGMHS